MAEAMVADLAAIRLASLLQLVEGEMFTGRLSLPMGRVDLKDGNVVGAKAGGLEGMEALRELFLTNSGSARLGAEPGVSGRALGGTIALVMEGCRIADEWDRIQGRVVHETPGFRAEPSGALTRDVLDAFDGTCTIREVLEALNVPPSRVVDPLIKLVDDGYLTEGPRPGAPAAAPKKAAAPSPVPAAASPVAAPALDFDTALEEGRRALKSGDFSRAEEAFRAALAQRPGDRVAAQNLKRVRLLAEQAS